MFYLWVMKLDEAKQQFIQHWGVLGTQWGINRTMAQIHALLLVSPDPLSADDIMNQLQISRGNTNMNVRDLMDWGIVEKILKPGERKEFFTADKDIWSVAMRIIKERKRREVEPIINALEQLKDIEGSKNDKEVKMFIDTMNDIQKFSNQASKAVDGLVKMDEHWFAGTLLKLFK
jgi:DNA-binding transcriptional regulator GbsR (MarR family)